MDSLNLVTVGHALGSSTRVAMLLAVADTPKTVTQLAEITGTHQTTATYHCRILAEAGLVVVDPVGSRRYVSLSARMLRIPLGRTQMQER
jgi:DNA-binding transcriptional ArsR family regulator